MKEFSTRQHIFCVVISIIQFYKWIFALCTSNSAWNKCVCWRRLL